MKAPFTFLSVTDDEISLVCPTENVPPNPIAAEDNWQALKISGILDFSLIGIIAKISAILANNGISVFVISTFNTDYVLIKYENFEEAVNLLIDGGYKVV